MDISGPGALDWRIYCMQIKKNNRLHFKRKIRKKTILRIIRDNAPVTAPQLSRMSGFNIPTTMSIIRELLEENYIYVIGKDVSTGGRPPSLYDIRPNSYFIVGVDVGRSFINMLIIDIRDQVIKERVLASPSCRESLEFMDFLISEISSLIANASVDTDKIIGMGVALPGPINYKDGTALRFCGQENFPIQEILSYRFNLPVFIENDARAMALGEIWYGKARQIPNAICLNLGWGIGMGIIIRGDVYRGSSNYAGEFGHIIVDPEGPECQCGRRGCLESVASGTAIARIAREALKQGRTRGLLFQKFADCPDKLEAQHVAEAARQGDAFSVELLKEAGHHLGNQLAVLVNLFNPEKIIVGGRLSLAGDLLLKPMEERLRQMALPFIVEKLKIEVSDISRISGALGAVSLVKREIYDVSQINLTSYV